MSVLCVVLAAGVEVAGSQCRGPGGDAAAADEVTVPPGPAGGEVCARADFTPGGLKRNIEFITGCVEFSHGVAEETRTLLFDPQTSGGLLLSVAPEDAPRLLSALRERNVPAREIGEVVEKTKPLILVR